MKKLLGFIAAVTLVATCMLSTAFAATANVTVAPSKATAEVGEEVTVEVKASGIDKLMSYTITLEATEGLELVSMDIANASFVKANPGQAFTNPDTAMAIYANAVDGTVKAGQDVLLIATYKVTAEGAQKVNASFSEIYNEAEDHTAVVTAATITVAEATTEAPTTEAPTTEAPATEAPTTEAPATDAPTTEAPATDAPTTEAPATDAPTTEAPTTEAPKTEAPNTGDNTAIMTYAVIMLVALAGTAVVIKKRA